MIEHADYYEAVIPEPFRILGLELLPLSLGHLLLLYRLESPFVSDAPKITIGDLALAVLICSRSYEDGLALLNDSRASNMLYQWAQRLTCQSGWRKCLPWLYKPIDMKAKAEAFRDYLVMHTKEPGYVATKEGGSKKLETPFLQVVKVTLMCKAGMNEVDILNRSWRLCLWDFITIKAIDGQLEMVDHTKLQAARDKANELQQRFYEQRRNGNG